MRRKLSLLLGITSMLFAARFAEAQTRVVTGRVTDAESQQGITGAVVSVVGGRQVAQANDQGNYRITVPSSDISLDIRALGYKRTNVRVPASQTTVNVSMDKEALQLSEVVVTGAATTEERRNVATAVTTVSAQTVATVPAASLENALQGKVVGATIQMNGGAPGGGGQMQIRGVTTILGNGDPLYVVDGVIISNVSISPGTDAVTQSSGKTTAQTSTDNPVNRLADLNPEDIESVQVLKSAAASAIYGSMATNGVVLITTKRGHSGATTFNWAQSYGDNSPQRLLGSRHFSNGTLAAALGNQAAANTYCPGSASTACPYYNDQGLLYGHGQGAYETNLSMSGGTDATKYYVSAHDKWDPGTLLNTDARRQDLRLNIDQTFGDRWTANASAGIYRSISDRGVANNDNTFASPIYGLSYDPAVVNLQQKDASGHYIADPLLPLIFGIGSNPFQLMQGLRSEEDVWRQIGSSTVKFAAYNSPSQTLALQATGGFDTFNDNGQTYAPPYLQVETYQALPGRSAQVGGNSRQVNGTVSLVHTWTPSGFLRQLTSATTSVGGQYEERYLNSYSVLALGLIPGLSDFTAGSSQTLTQTVTDVRNQALYASEEVLAFNEKLSLSGRVRAERSSVNGNPDKFYLWPAGSLAYHIPTFIPGSDDIKLRGAIGISGNQPLYGERDLTLLAPGIIGGQNALTAPSTVGNANIRPEQMQEDELGVDATFWNSRLGFEVSAFQRDITQLLLQASLAPSSGIGSEYINGGHMRNRGLELGMNLFPIRGPSFTWTSHTSWYSYSSKIVSLPVAPFSAPSSGYGAQFGSGRIQQGYLTTLIWGNDETSLNSTNVKLVPIANANPKFYMNFSNDFQLKNWTLSTLLDWKDGGYVSCMTCQQFDEGFNSWDYDKPSPNTAVGSTLGAYRYNTWNGGNFPSVYIKDGSYLKLREVTLAYRIPQQYSSRFFGGHDARVQVSGRNLLTISPYPGFDPEVANFGDQNVLKAVDLAPYPPTRSFTAGFNIGF